MPVGNYGVVMNLLQGIMAAEYANTRHNQGASLFVRLVGDVLMRSDLTEANARVTLPVFFDGAADVDVEAGAVRLVGIWCDNTEAAANILTVYEAAAVTEGTTVGIGGYYYPKASTARGWARRWGHGAVNGDESAECKLASADTADC